MPLPPREASVMSGKRRYILDTNAVISFLSGNREFAAQLETAEYIGISVVSYLEFLSFDGLSEEDCLCFKQFCERIEVVELRHDDIRLTEKALELRRKYRMKLPDAIIGATAISLNAFLITNDSHFHGIASLTVLGC